jgi:membrane-bound lytic murein transglycosylase A
MALLTRCLLTLMPLVALGAQECPWPAFTPVSWEEVPDPFADPAFAQGSNKDLLAALDTTLIWFATPAARKAYEDAGPEALPRVRRSLEALRDLADSGLPAEGLRQALRVRFQPFALRDPGRFTAYCEAYFEASRTPTTTFRYPLYRAPRNLASWPRPHPTRLALEGRDGLQGRKGPLKGLELVWLKSRFDAYLVQVQGSATLRLTDGGTLRVGFAGRTDHPFVAVGDLLAKDQAAAGSSPAGGVYAQLRASADLQEAYLPRNPRFVFFTTTEGPRKGSYGIPLTPFRSFAADDRVLPPGALTLLQGDFPKEGGAKPESAPGVRFALHHDQGGAIQGPGRLDLFVGGGPDSLALAGTVNGPGRTYLLLLRADPGDENLKGKLKLNNLAGDGRSE